MYMRRKTLSLLLGTRYSTFSSLALNCDASFFSFETQLLWRCFLFCDSTSMFFFLNFGAQCVHRAIIPNRDGGVFFVYLQPLTVGQIRIQSRFEQGPGDSCHGGRGPLAPGVRRRAGNQMQGRVALVRSHRADGRAVGQQEVRRVRVAPLHGQVQKRTSVTIADVRIGLVLAQHFGNTGLMIAQRQVQSRFAFVVQFVDFGVQLRKRTKALLVFIEAPPLSSCFVKKSKNYH